MIQEILESIVMQAVDAGYSNSRLRDIGANAFDGRVYAAHLAWICAVIGPEYVFKFDAMEGLGYAMYNDFGDTDGAKMASLRGRGYQTAKAWSLRVWFGRVPSASG